MSLKKLTNQNLDAQLKSLVTSEREILSEILLHIAEVERRKLYLIFGYSSLFEYLTKSIGYANGSAQRRIDAARLSFYAPTVINKLESGQINLAQISLLQKSIREVQVISKTRINTQVKESLIEQLSSKSFAESEVLIAQAFNLQPKELTKTKYQKDESVRLEITFSKAQWEKLMKMRVLLSHSLPHGSNWDRVFEYVSEKVIKQKDRSQSVAKPCPVKKIEANKETVSLLRTAKKPINAVRQPISASVQRKVFQRDLCCQFQNKTTSKQCGSTWKLTIDHLKPIWAGGTNEGENLRILCAAHNRELYRQQSNLSKS